MQSRRKYSQPNLIQFIQPTPLPLRQLVRDRFSVSPTACLGPSLDQTQIWLRWHPPHHIRPLAMRCRPLTPKHKTTSQQTANQTKNKSRQPSQSNNPAKTTNQNTRSFKRYPVGKRGEIGVQVKAGNIIKMASALPMPLGSSRRRRNQGSRFGKGQIRTHDKKIAVGAVEYQISPKHPVVKEKMTKKSHFRLF